MPARVSITLGETDFRHALQELEIDQNPPDMILNYSGHHPELSKQHGVVRSVYVPSDHHILITTQGEAFEREGLLVMTKHLRFTVLHELRHAHQHTHWSAEQLIEARRGPYELRGVELDANAWADYAMPIYPGLVIVKRQQVGKSGFARMNERAGL